MRTFLLAALLCFAVSANGLAQQAAPDAPATKEDVEKYLQVAHARENAQHMVDAMLAPLQQAIHQEFQKDQSKLPADFEARMNKIMADYMKAMPFDQMIDAMVPIYEKHFSERDLAALTAFYSTDSGQRILHEMPAIAAESMKAMLPVMQPQIEEMQKRLQQDVADMMKEVQSKPVN